MVQQSSRKSVWTIRWPKCSLVGALESFSPSDVRICAWIDISKVQDDEVGDGTTSVVVLASELLRVNRPMSKQYDRDLRRSRKPRIY